jgi:TfoX/Sxy family transcriptional regulator of competence genes
VVILAPYISSLLYSTVKGDDKVKRSKSILVRLTEQEQSELIQAVEDWNQSRESWQDEMSISKYIREAIEEKIDREKRKRKRNT